MRCVNCGTENEERNLNCSVCGAELNAEMKLTALKNKKSIAIISIISFVLLIAVVIIINMIILPDSAANKMEKAFASKSSQQVITVFTKYCTADETAYEDLTKSGKKVCEQFESCVESIKADLNEQNADVDINDYLVDNYGDIFLPQEYSALTVIADYNRSIAPVTADFYKLYSSKISYEKGMIAFNSQDFSSAVNAFLCVIEEDSFYEDAQNKLSEAQNKVLESNIAKIEKYISEGRLEAAQSEIDSLRTKSLTDDIVKRLDEYEIKIMEARLAKIDEYVNNGDMEGAQKYIESLGDGLSEQAKERLNQAIKNKANDYITKADEALKSGERQGAYDMAVMAQSLCPEDEKINKKVEYFKEYLPFKLYISNNYLSQNKTQSCWLDYNRKCTANNSNTMSNCVSVSFHPWHSGMYASVTYNLGKKYDVISGTQFVTQSSKNIDQKGYFEIYGDGKKIFTSSVMGVNFLPTNFSVKVTGVDTLIVKYYDDPNPKNGLDYPEYGISNFVATKNLPE